ncbi:MAG: hypothetical protein CMP67_01725 [Flavobacteriales bacterium]|nr:hypothetical protein [Flavobacteriales bacterium]MBO72808.1 hypothetical protein [Flavobacteriales bacterium]|tara:strand:- start:7083 stop:7700 length:618 start_codon:yes stop_codon:yes gene_type:complete
MKKIITSLAVILILASCGESNDECCKKKEASCKSKKEESCESKEVSKTGNLNAFEENLAAFNACKESTPGNGKCKEFLAKAVCEYYAIDDLKEGGNYVDYDKIPTKLKELESWENLGDFDEKNITTALEKLNNFGKPVLIFNEDASYVHVVALTPNGKSMKSGKWGGISVPSCISYFPKRKDSFTEKGVNYAFKSADDLTIWTKK